MGFAPKPFLFWPRSLTAAGGGDGTGAGPARGRWRRAAGCGPGVRDMISQGDHAGAEPASAPSPPPSGVAQLLSALFYGTCSFLIVLVNKALLTTYR